jgi:hypothetical protein
LRFSIIHGSYCEIRSAEEFTAGKPSENRRFAYLLRSLLLSNLLSGHRVDTSWDRESRVMASRVRAQRTAAAAWLVVLGCSSSLPESQCLCPAVAVYGKPSSSSGMANGIAGGPRVQRTALAWPSDGESIGRRGQRTGLHLKPAGGFDGAQPSKKVALNTLALPAGGEESVREVIRRRKPCLMLCHRYATARVGSRVEKVANNARGELFGRCGTGN